MEHVLDHTKSTDFMDATNSTYFDNGLSGLDYLQYPGESFDMSCEHFVFVQTLNN